MMGDISLAGASLSGLGVPREPRVFLGRKSASGRGINRLSPCLDALT